MANTHKNIVITPNRGSNTLDPKIRFTGADANTTANIDVFVYPTSNGTLSFKNNDTVELFSIVNSLDGVIFAVNDENAQAIIRANSDGKVYFNEYSGNTYFANNVQVYGTINAANILINGNVISGGGSPSAGNVGQIQFANTGSTFGASGNLVWSTSNNALEIAGNLDVIGTATYVNTNGILVGTSEINSFSVITTTVSEQTIDSFANTQQRSAHYTITMNVSNSYHTTQIVLIHNDSTAYMTQYGSIYTVDDLGLFDAYYDASGIIKLNVTPTYANTTFKMLRLSSK